MKNSFILKLPALPFSQRHIRNKLYLCSDFKDYKYCYFERVSTQSLKSEQVNIMLKYSRYLFEKRTAPPHVAEK